MRFIETSIPGCYEISPKVFSDARGKLVKVFHQGLFLEKKLETNFVEDFYSISQQKVLRGMHFQLPPHDHIKLVYCIEGEVLDVLVDLRLGSPAYGLPFSFALSAAKANVLYIPKGIAHGFYTLSQSATMVYKTTSLYNEDYDSGVLWSSFAIWPDVRPMVSAKDSSLLHLDSFQTPFRFLE
jgi:dTDP-4-dehydrorhamnose 3,5-epimerase